MNIGNFIINKESKTFVIAEMSANHGGSIENAKRTIWAAKEAGADAIKLQTYTADTLTIDCDNEYFRLSSGTIWDGKTLYELYSEAYTPWEWHKELFDYAKEVGIICFSTPFDFTAVDFLEELDVPAYKIASFEIVDIPLIKYCARKRKPMIISIGTAGLQEITKAVEACLEVGNDDIILLQCSSQYPADASDANLRTMQEIKRIYNVEIGISDHTVGSVVPIAAVALGAKVVEKHFIITREIGGPDASFSMEQNEFKKMVEDVRMAEAAIGKVDFSISDKKKNAKDLGRSLFIVEDIKCGDILTEKNVRSIRPGMGISPEYYYGVLGKKVTRDIKRGTPLKWEFLFEK